METRHLGLSENLIFGWERRKNIILVDAIQKGIRAGDTFCPIELIKVRDNTYFLIPPESLNRDEEYKSGGHHRVYAYLRENTPLPYILRSLPPYEISWVIRENRVSIAEITLFDHRKVIDREVQRAIFEERSINYPRINWKKWRIKPNRRWIEKYFS